MPFTLALAVHTPSIMQDWPYPQNQGWNNYTYSQYPHYRSYPYGGGRSPNPYNNIPAPTTPHPVYTPLGTQQGLSSSYWADTPPPRRYPHLNPALAFNETVIHYDVRKKPKSSIPPHLYNHRGARACTTSPMLLFSELLPWGLELTSPSGTLISCGMVWDAIYHALQEPIAAAEWGILVLSGDEKQKDVVQTAARRRKEKRPKDDGHLRRIDWLGDATMFMGLEKNEGFIKSMILPGRTLPDEAWVMKFALSWEE
jgi:hypothetical protein